MNEFANEVIGQPEVIDSFNNYKEEYQRDRDIEIADNFTISDSAVKKQSRGLKSVIKLDKNFHIYVHGNNQYIKKDLMKKRDCIIISSSSKKNSNILPENTLH